jgi:hypothetical protein
VVIHLDTMTYLARRRTHEQRVDDLLAEPIRRRRRGETHPVDDFLFTYYSYRPSALRRWHPGVGTAICGSGAADFAGWRGYALEPDRASVDPTWTEAHRDRVNWIRTLLEATSRRPSMLGCFGLHEWAMVYQQPADAVRHHRYPLRLGARATDAVVESHRITCTHFDAFRFFTEPARPLNVLQPTRASQAELEQPGCLHASMDLYKWSYKLAPLTPSELVVDCFDLALDVRQVDMAAAPYDLTSLGIEPIAIETPAGKAAYVIAQRAFADRASVLRRQLISVCDVALSLRPHQPALLRAEVRT